MFRRIVGVAAACLLTTTGLNAQTAAISPDNAEFVTEQAVLSAPGVGHIAWSPDGETLAAATSGGVLLFNARRWDAPPDLLGQASPTIDLAYSPDGEILAAVTGSTIRLWDVPNEREIGSLTGSAPIAFSTDGRRLAYTNGSSLVLFDLETQAITGIADSHTDRITDIAFSPAGSMVSTTSLDNTLRYWDDVTGEAFGFQRSRRRPLLTNAISPNGALILSGARGGVLRLLNVAVTTESTFTIRPREDITSVEFNPVTGVVLFASGNRAGIWDTSLGDVVAIYSAGDAPLLQAAFNPRGDIIATASLDGVIRLWWVG